MTVYDHIIPANSHINWTVKWNVDCELWVSAKYSYLPRSPVGSSHYVQINVFINNRASSQGDKFWARSIASTVSWQLCLSISSLSPADKRPQPCHCSVATIDYHSLLSGSRLLPTPNYYLSLNNYLLFFFHTSFLYRLQAWCLFLSPAAYKQR